MTGRPYIAPAMLAKILPMRGYAPGYHGAETRCPCCSRTNWLVGRMLAECAFCSTAIPLREAA